MKMYIRATGNISPQKSFGNTGFLTELMEYTGNRLNCDEPDYKDFIDPKMIRRMSRIIRMGVTAALECLKESGIPVPDAIVTGTAYGCLQDTDLFLTKMIGQQEELLTPTAFIQSTHNTIGAQIGLILKCNNYNNTFVHRGFSFESALLDGMMLLMDNAASNVLVGAIDELTDTSFAILNRFCVYKRKAVSNIDLYKTVSKGTIAGEGAAFFLLSNISSCADCAALNAITTFYKPKSSEEIQKQVDVFLAAQRTTMNDIDLIIVGKNGDTKNDEVYSKLQQGIFKDKPSLNYKNLCGEYPTSTAFALWLAANILKKGIIPSSLEIAGNPAKPVRKILIYNHYQHIHHSLLLLSAC